MRAMLWTMVALAGCVAWLFAVIAATMKGPWLALLAPAGACVYVALDTARLARERGSYAGP